MNAFRPNASLRLVAAAVAMALLAGCASSGSTSLVKRERSHTSNSIRPNVAYMKAVERQAGQRGVEVVWFNPPKELLVATVTESN